MTFDSGDGDCGCGKEDHDVATIQRKPEIVACSSVGLQYSVDGC